jgi:hypothetical protein
MKRKKRKKINYNRVVTKTFLVVLIITLLLLSFYLIQIFLNQEHFAASTTKAPVLGTSVEILGDGGDLSFWQDYVKLHPKYFPGWLKLAQLESERDNFDNFLDALKKAEILNPNSKEVRELKFRYGI